MARLSLDNERCQGHGRCYALSPDLFDCDDSGYAVLLAERVSAADVQAARTAVDACPEQAITLDESVDE